MSVPGHKIFEPRSVALSPRWVSWPFERGSGVFVLDFPMRFWCNLLGNQHPERRGGLPGVHQYLEAEPGRPLT